MSSTGISFSGLASGIDSGAIIKALMSLERRPIGLLEKKNVGFKKAKDLFGKLETKLNDLKDASDDIKLSTNFLDFKTATDNENKYLSASAGNNAIAGTYDIIVKQLATSEVRASDTRATSNEEVISSSSGSGFLTFAMGDGTNVSSGTIEVPASLETIRDAINDGDTSDYLQAQIIDTGDPSTPFELVITSKVEGSDGTFTVSSDPSGPGEWDNFVAELNGSGANNPVVGADAELSVNGIDVVRSSNKITDLITGVTLDLTGEDSTGLIATKLTVSADGEATGEKIKEFINKYNDIIDFIEAQSKVDEDGQTGSPIFGDSSLRSIRSSLRSIMGKEIDTGNSEFSLLSQIGISADTEGKLTFNQGEFDEALAEDEGAVEKLFSMNTSSDVGIARQMIDAIEVYTDSVDGVLISRKKGFDTRIKNTDQNIERLERRLEQFELNLTNKYANLEGIISQLNSQGSALNSLR